MEFCEDAALNLMAQLDVSVLGSGREQQEQKAHNVTATMGYIVDFVQEQWDARPSEAVVLRVHRMLTYSVPYRHNIRGRYRPRRGRRLYLLPPDGDQVRRLVAEFARWFNEGPPARRDSVIVTHHHVRRGGWGVHSCPDDALKHLSHATENVEIGPPRIRRPRAVIFHSSNRTFADSTNYIDKSDNWTKP